MLISFFLYAQQQTLWHNLKSVLTMCRTATLRTLKLTLNKVLVFLSYLVVSTLFVAMQKLMCRCSQAQLRSNK